MGPGVGVDRLSLPSRPGPLGKGPPWAAALGPQGRGELPCAEGSRRCRDWPRVGAGGVGLGLDSARCSAPWLQLTSPFIQ